MTNQVKFNRRERIGFISLLLLSAMSLAGNLSDMRWQESRSENLDLISHIRFESPAHDLGPVGLDTSKFVSFDPNAMTEEIFQIFDINMYARKSWRSYLDKGYLFYKTEDIKKIYGLKDEEYNRMQAFVEIKKKKYTRKYRKSEKFKVDTGATKKKNVGQREEDFDIEINTASVEDFQKLKGIGPKRSKTIVKFREKLGGFHSIEQIGEVYGIDSILYASLKEKLKVDTLKFDRIDLDVLRTDSIVQHLYLGYKDRKKIRAWLYMQGETAQKSELINIKGIDSIKIRKLIPYLKE